MTPEEFSIKCKAASVANPVLDFAVELLAAHVTERQLMDWLEEQSLLSGPFKNNLYNTYRSLQRFNQNLSGGR